MTADLTIVVATYERPEWLELSLRSIQTAASFAGQRGMATRILVVDDGSPTARTAEVCRVLGVDYLRNEVNDGHNDPSEARVLGLRSVDTAFYALFDDDDVMLPRWIVAHLEAIGEADVCYGGYIVVDEDLRPIHVHRPLRYAFGDLLADHNPVNDHCVVRSTHMDGIWRPELRKAMPFAAWLELGARGARFHRLDEPTYLYRRHQANMSDDAATDTEFAAAREALVADHRSRAAQRHGRVPTASGSLRLRRAVPPTVRQRLRRLARRRPR